MNNSTNKALLRQRRIMSYFIEAADEIIMEEGASAVTIRTVADKAGYSSATLYNYFDNLNHLIFLATMKHLDEYNDDVALLLKSQRNPLDLYLVVSECFCRHSFSAPEIYNLLFFHNQDGKIEEYTKQHYELFGDQEKVPSATFSKIIGVNNLHRRSLIMLTDCAEEGYMSLEDATDLNEVAMLLYRSILTDVMDGKIGAAEATAKTMKYYRQLMGFYIKPKYRQLLEI